jgi:hypothetical protein
MGDVPPFMKKIIARLIAFVAVLVPSVAFAVTLDNPLGVTSLAEFLVRLLKIVSAIAFPMLVLFLVYVGFLFVKAEGNADELKKVRSYFFWAVVGGLLVLGSQVLAYAIQATVDAIGM